MNKKNIIPQQTQPINRITTGQLTSELAELSEEVLSDNNFSVGAAIETREGPCYAHEGYCLPYICSYDGDKE